jgi:hypothetical protein
MIFYDNENLIQLNKELWVIPVLLLIILFYLTREKRNRKIIIAISTIYVLFLLYNLYYVFLPLFTLEDTLYYYVEYPFGFVFLGLTLFLILNIFFPNKYSSYIALVLLSIVIFNQVYLRIQTSKIDPEYENILENNGRGNVLTVDIDTTDNNYSNFFAGDPGFLHSFEVYKNISFTPYFALKEEHFINFKFPNYYWTKYRTVDRQHKVAPITGDFVPPKIREKYLLKTKSKIDEFFVLFRIDSNGKLLDSIRIFPDSLSFINKQEYFNSIRIIPAHLNGKPVRSSFGKKYVQ